MKCIWVTTCFASLIWSAVNPHDPVWYFKFKQFQPFNRFAPFKSFKRSGDLGNSHVSRITETSK